MKFFVIGDTLKSLKEIYNCPQAPSLRSTSAAYTIIMSCQPYVTNVQTLGRMPKRFGQRCLKLLLHILMRIHYRLIHTHTHTYSQSEHKHLATDTPLVPYASVPANYKRSNQFHHHPVQGNRLQWHQLHGHCLCTWQPLTHKQGPSQPAFCCSPLQGRGRQTTAWFQKRQRIIHIHFVLYIICSQLLHWELTNRYSYSRFAIHLVIIVLLTGVWLHRQVSIK